MAADAFNAEVISRLDAVSPRGVSSAGFERFAVTDPLGSRVPLADLSTPSDPPDPPVRRVRLLAGVSMIPPNAPLLGGIELLRKALFSLSASGDATSCKSTETAVGNFTGMFMMIFLTRIR
ncbi:hypothetical protein DWV00_32760 [Trinickia dinghuensis]|uniref:Uncharacterized protein n=1 Tax=Trinickia dinghuensis TaxID=2291023 RepID=A0A3D8JNU0_9BURK|nr:hypothetical protein DWV00_32760 [Trinickia dinghuensis]